MEKESLGDQGLHSEQQFIKVRCPQCFKLFSVSSAEIVVAQPKFSCKSCQCKFWLSYPECLSQGEIIGFPLEWIEPQNDPPDNAEQQKEYFKPSSLVQGIEPAGFVLDCPKCATPYERGEKECKKCGVIFTKVFALQKETLQASKEVKSFWEKIIEEYENIDLHQKFVRQCLKEDYLDYASSKYRQILEVHPSDEVARKMTREIEALVSREVLLKSSEEKPKKTKRKIPFLALIIFLSTTVMVFGFFVPELRNLVGLGASTLFLTVAIKFWAR